MPIYYTRFLLPGNLFFCSARHTWHLETKLGNWCNGCIYCALWSYCFTKALLFYLFIYFALFAQWEAVSSIFKDVRLIHISEREALKGSDAEEGLLLAHEGGFLQQLK